MLQPGCVLLRSAGQRASGRERAPQLLGEGTFICVPGEGAASAVFSHRLADSTGGGIADRREKFRGRKGDKGGDPLVFFWLGGKQAYNLEKLLRRRELGLFTIN